MTPVYNEHTPNLEMHDTRSITYMKTNMVEAILIELGRQKIVNHSEITGKMN